MIVDIKNDPEPKQEPVPIINETVARSIAKPDAFMKPATIGKHTAGAKVRVRLTNQRPPGRPRKHKRDPRDVKFW
jgi:hypothetical protein